MIFLSGWCYGLFVGGSAPKYLANRDVDPGSKPLLLYAVLARILTPLASWERHFHDLCAGLADLVIRPERRWFGQC